LRLLTTWFRPVQWRIQLTCMFSKRLCPWTSRTRRCTHPEYSAAILIPVFSPESSSTRGAFLLPSTRGAYLDLFTRGGYLLTDSLAECQVQGKLKPRLSSPYDLFKRRIRNGSLWADVSLRKTLPQTSLPVSKHWVASRERLNINLGISFRTDMEYIKYYSTFLGRSTNRQVAGSIPDGVIGIFQWHNSSGRTMVLGSTQPLT